MEKSYEERQAKCGLKVGDKVRILRKAEDHEDGWGEEWAFSMDNTIVKIVKIVERYNLFGIKVSIEGFRDFYFPYFVLEKVNEEPKQEQKETPKEGFSKLTFHFTNGEVLNFVGRKNGGVDNQKFYYDEDGNSYNILWDKVVYLKEEKI